MSGRVGDKVYVNGRFGQIVRPYVPPRNQKRRADQDDRRFGALASQWRGLEPEARFAWCAASIRDGLRISGYSYFMKLNAPRIHIGLSRLDYPPSRRPSFDINSVAEVAVVVNDGKASIKLHVPSPPAQHTLVEVAAPVSAGVRFVQGYRYVGLLPAPVDGWSDITELVVAPLWRADARQGALHPDPPADGRLDGRREGDQRAGPVRLAGPSGLLPAPNGAGARPASRRKRTSCTREARQTPSPPQNHPAKPLGGAVVTDSRPPPPPPAPPSAPTPPP